MIRAADYFATKGIRHIEQVITDNHLSYRRSLAFANAVTELGAKQLFIRPHCPWQNGKAGTPQPNPSDRMSPPAAPSSPNTHRAAALLHPGFEHSQHSTTSQRTGGLPPISRL